MTDDPIIPVRADDLRKGMAMLDEMNSPLDPSLEPFVHRCAGTMMMIRHPFACELLVPGMCGLVNRRVTHRREMASKALRNKAWCRYVWTHQRPFRLDAYLKVMDRMGDRTRWNMLAQVWRDSEFPHVNQRVWEVLWSDRRPGREFAMTAADRRTWNDLVARDEVCVHRGVTDARGRAGLSWTTDSDKAVWFARRFAPEGRPASVYTITVPGSALLAFMDSRRESEVIVDPRVLRAMRPRDFRRRVA